MTLMRRNPYDPFSDMTPVMDHLWNRMETMWNTALAPVNDDWFQPSDLNSLAVDMTSNENEIIVRTALPGFKEDEVDVKVQGNVLTISAESKTEREDHQANWHIRELRYGTFARSLVLPDEVVTDRADASLENGILTVKLPKQKPNAVQRIAVKARQLLKGKNNENGKSQGSGDE